MMSEDKPRISSTVPIGGILLLFIGIVLSLQVTNILPWSLWGTLWKFWPVIIILLGLGMLLQRVNVWLVSLLTLVILGACLGVAVWQNSPNLSGDIRIVGESYSYPANGLQRAEAKVDFSAGSLIIEKLNPNSANLVEAEATHDGARFFRSKQQQRITMIPDFSQDGVVGSLSLKPTNQQFWNKWDIGWRLGFNQWIPLSLNLKCGASNVSLDLRDLEVSVLYLEMNASDGKLIIPVSVKNSIVDIDMNVSNLEITVPEGVAAKIHTDANLSISEIDQNRFPKQGDYYISSNYDSAINRVELKILCDIGRITVK
jgi:hypothetical protein